MFENHLNSEKYKKAGFAMEVIWCVYICIEMYFYNVTDSKNIDSKNRIELYWIKIAHKFNGTQNPSYIAITTFRN